MSEQRLRWWQWPIVVLVVAPIALVLYCRDRWVQP